MLTGSSTSPFAAIESAIYKTLFSSDSPYAALTSEVNKACIDNAATKESSKSRVAGTRSPASPVKGQSGSLKAKEESENTETTCRKKTN